MQTINLIGKLSAGGGGSYEPVIEPKTITENGTYTAPEGVDGYSPIDVLVAPLLEDRYINANGQYGPTEGYDGIRRLTVEVPVPSISPVTITENGTYTDPSGNGYNPITVNVPATTLLISSNNNKAKLGMHNVNNTNELVFNFENIYINSVENLDFFTNQKIIEGLDTNTLKYTKVYSDSNQTTALGWIGFYQNSIRAWNLDLTANINITGAWGSLIITSDTTQQENTFIEL